MTVNSEKHYKVAIVILNYLNFKDTIECVDSTAILDYPVQKVIVVDNGSNNDSVDQLKKNYGHNDKVDIIQVKQNLGFAKGNNVGIKRAKEKYNADFVLVVNNDTKFLEPNYISSLLDAYESGVGVIGSRIRLLDGSIQNQSKSPFEIKECVKYFINLYSANKGSCFDFNIERKNGVKVLHGSALLFTPDFFRYYKGFYPKTFLYHEEEILYLMCCYKKLRQVYVETTEIFHKEDQSSKLSFENEKSIKQRFAYQSYKYVLWWLFKCRLRSMIIK